MTPRNQSGTFSASSNPQLNARHLKLLEERGIPIATAKAARLASVGKYEGAELLNLESPLKSEALAIPYLYEPKEESDYWRLRLDEGTLRYLSPKAGVRPYVPWPTVVSDTIWIDISATIHLVEAPLKALSLCSFGFPAIGLGGVNTGHDTKLWKESRTAQLHPELLRRIKWRGRTVVVIFDANRATNPEVAEGEARLVWALYNAGAASVRVVQLPGKETGPDDYLADRVRLHCDNGESLEEARQKAASDFAGLLSEAREADPRKLLASLIGSPDKEKRAQELLSDLPFLASLYLRGVELFDVCAPELKKLGLKTKSVKQKVKEFAKLLKEFRRDFAEGPREELLQIRTGTDLHRVVDESIAALSTAKNIFQRSSELVVVVRDLNHPAWIQRSHNAPTIQSISVPALREHLTRVALFIYWSEKCEGWVATLPPEPVVQALAARKTWADIRHIKGVREAPFLRPDGSLCQATGFDERTGFLLSLSENFPKIPEHPTHEEAITARDALLEAVCDFPFASDVYRAAWLALVLTLFARPAIEGPCPLFALDANTRGSGKSRLTDVPAILLTGREATRTTQPENDDEMRKRITALLLEGEPFAVLDNVKRALGGGALEALITTPAEWKDRVLGHTSMVSAPALTVWACSGNNLSFTDDLIRRTLHIRLESPLAHPEDRDDKEFKHPNLIGWVKQERPRLVAAALTMLRAWYAAGQPRPEGMKLWGSFEAWSAIVPPCLFWAGLPDPIVAHRELSSSAHNDGPIIAFLQELSALLQKKSVQDLPARELLNEAYPERGLFKGEQDAASFRVALEGIAQGKAGKAVTANSLGYALRAYKGRVFSVDGRELSLECRQDRLKTARWYVKQLEAQVMQAIAGDVSASTANEEKNDVDNRPHENSLLTREAPRHHLQCPASPAVHSEEDLSKEELEEYRLMLFNLQFDQGKSESEAKEEAQRAFGINQKGRV